MTRGNQTILVTVGSTLFPSLTCFVLSPTILQLLSSLGIGKLIVQYGKANLPISVVDQLQMDGNGNGSGQIANLNVIVMRYTDNFEHLVHNADAVVSHAGSGSILAVLRQRPMKPLLVVPNESLMDNHQVELANALGQDGYLLVSRIPELETKLKEFFGHWKDKQRDFPPRADTFKNVVNELMGFE
nr:hypothetical protein L204_04229 [Cryptococcus depauperatus CBS 7855]